MRGGEHVLVAYTVELRKRGTLYEAAARMASRGRDTVVYYIDSSPENEEVKIAYPRHQIESLMGGPGIGSILSLPPGKLTNDFRHADVYDIYFPPLSVAALSGRLSALGSAICLHGLALGGTFSWVFMPPVGGGEGVAIRGTYEGDDYR